MILERAKKSVFFLIKILFGYGDARRCQGFHFPNSIYHFRTALVTTLAAALRHSPAQRSKKGGELFIPVNLFSRHSEDTGQKEMSSIGQMSSSTSANKWCSRHFFTVLRSVQTWSSQSRKNKNQVIICCNFDCRTRAMSPFLTSHEC